VLQGSATAVITSPTNEVCRDLQKMGPDAAHVEVATLDYDDSAARPSNLHLGIRLEKYLAGEKAVEMLLSMIRGDHSQPEVTTLPSRLEIFDPTA
jgi:hypothetical protein